MPEINTTETPKKKGTNTLVIILVLFLILGACGLLTLKLAGSAIKRALNLSGVNIDTDSGSTTIKTKDGEITVNQDGKTGTITTNEGEVKYGENLALPSNFPKNIPVYPSGKITAISTTTDSTFLAMTISDSAQTISKYMNNEFTKKGWKVQTDITDVVTTYTNGKSVAAVTFTQEDDNQTTITISVTPDTSGAN